jgi:hypothetical protein
MFTAQQVTADRELQLAAAAGSLAHAAAQRGGTVFGTAAELHQFCTSSSPLWPRSAAQLDAETLPILAHRSPYAGATVRRLSNHQWEIRHAPAPIPPRAA